MTHHSSQESFRDRADSFRKWLGTMASQLRPDQITFVFSHGGTLTDAFRPTEKFGNCEMRVFDIDCEGNFLRVERERERDRERERERERESTDCVCNMQVAPHPSPSLLTASDDVICPLSLRPIVFPMRDAEGFIYERDAILNWIEGHSTSPLTGNPMRRDDLVEVHVDAAKESESGRDSLTFAIQRVEFDGERTYIVYGTTDGQVRFPLSL